MTVDFWKIFADEKLYLVCKQAKHAFRKETFQVNKELKEIIEKTKLRLPMQLLLVISFWDWMENTF